MADPPTLRDPGGRKWATVADICTNHQLHGAAPGDMSWEIYITNKIKSFAKSALDGGELTKALNDAVLKDRALAPLLDPNMRMYTIKCLVNLVGQARTRHQKAIKRETSEDENFGMGLAKRRRMDNSRDSVPAYGNHIFSLPERLSEPRAQEHKVDNLDEPRLMAVKLWSAPDVHGERKMLKRNYVDFVQIAENPSKAHLSSILERKYALHPIHLAVIKSTVPGEVDLDLDDDDDVRGWVRDVRGGIQCTVEVQLQSPVDAGPTHDPATGSASGLVAEEPAAQEHGRLIGHTTHRPGVTELQAAQGNGQQSAVTSTTARDSNRCRPPEPATPDDTESNSINACDTETEAKPNNRNTPIPKTPPVKQSKWGLGSDMGCNSSQDENNPSTDIPKSAQTVTDEDLRRFQHAFYIDNGAEWNPTEQMYNPLFTEVKGYQFLTAWWMIVTEGRDNVGGCLGHEPGLGKTRICTVMLVLNHVMGFIRRTVEREWRSGPEASAPKHLPQNCDDEHAQCPSDFTRQNAGIRCFCEPTMRYFYSFCTDTASVVTAAPSILSVWVGDFTGAPRQDAIESFTGRKMVFTVAHHKSQNVTGLTPFTEVVNDIRSPTPTQEEWMSANPTFTTWEDLRWRHSESDKDEVVKPALEARSGSHVCIITTQFSVKKRVMEVCQTTILNSQTVSVVCDKGRRCRNRPSCKHNTHNWKCPTETLVGLQIGRWFMDECHGYKNIDHDAHKSFRRHVNDVTEVNGVVPRLWAVTGTPCPDNLTDLLPMFAQQETAGWCSDDNPLSRWTSLTVEAAALVEAVHRKAVMGDKLTANEKKAFDEEFRTDKDNREATARLQFETLVKPLTTQWFERFMIQLSEESSINNHRVLVLPEFSADVKQLECDPRVYGRLDAMADAFADSCDRIRKMRIARDGLVGKAPKDDLAQALKDAENKWRILMLSIDMPFLIDEFAKTPSLVLAKHITSKGWWDKPSESPLWDSWQDLLESSPKLKVVVNEAKSRAKMETEIELDGGGTVKAEHRDKIIFAAYEPLFALCIYTVLVRSLEREYGGLENAFKAIKVVWKGGIMVDVVKYFQLELNNSGTDCCRPSVDIIILLARVGSMGITLTKADRLIMVDIDPSSARNQQLQKRHHRISQARDATFVQLVSDFADIQETLLRKRLNGERITSGVMELHRRQGVVKQDEHVEQGEGGDHPSRAIQIYD